LAKASSPSVLREPERKMIDRQRIESEIIGFSKYGNGQGGLAKRSDLFSEPGELGDDSELGDDDDDDDVKRMGTRLCVTASSFDNYSIPSPPWAAE
jgi:hypothetical protein